MQTARECQCGRRPDCCMEVCSGPVCGDCSPGGVGGMGASSSQERAERMRNTMDTSNSSQPIAPAIVMQSTMVFVLDMRPGLLLRVTLTNAPDGARIETSRRPVPRGSTTRQSPCRQYKVFGSISRGGRYASNGNRVGRADPGGQAEKGLWRSDQGLCFSGTSPVSLFGRWSDWMMGSSGKAFHDESGVRRFVEAVLPRANWKDDGRSCRRERPAFLRIQSTRRCPPCPHQS